MSLCGQVPVCHATVEHVWATKSKLDGESSEESGEEVTPTTTASEADSSDIAGDEDLELMTKEDLIEDVCEDQPAAVVPVQLGPGLFPSAQGGTLLDDHNDSDDECNHGGSAPSGLCSQQAGDTCEGPSTLTPILPSAPLATVASQPPQEARSADYGGISCHEAPAKSSSDALSSPSPSTRVTETKQAAEAATETSDQEVMQARFTADETLFIFDWDDTVLPSSWIQGQGLRLDEGSSVNAWQRQHLTEVANLAAETLRMAKQHGTVILVTNAERGWIELSCLKFLPTLYPSLENVKLMSARTTYECVRTYSPLDWKLRAFESEINRIYGVETLLAPSRRKNVLSLGDSVHEREALYTATASLPTCCAKSLKFCERPDIAQICKQHSLVTSCFEQIVHHDGNLDLCIRCT
mmetsp:Transcript_9937/g.26775  ORF Transcript_9937/g.26775 Transcript_9937/m.26775 type:complete len:410 (-) Transcript_9937:289-1518(-)